MAIPVANFLINIRAATTADLEGQGEAVMPNVMLKFGAVLAWEIKRVG